MSVFSVSNAAQLSSALQAAQGGDTISLAGGNYGDVLIKSQFASDVTITSQSALAPATFHSLGLIDARHIHLDDLNIALTPTATSYIFTPAVLLNGASSITVTGGAITGGAAINGIDPSATALDATCNVIGLPTGYGINIQKSSGVTVAGVDISHFAKGVVLSQSDTITLSHNEVHDLRTSGIVGSGLNHVTIDSNHIHDSNPWRWGQTPVGDHGDFLAFWTDTTPSTDIKITNNLMEQGKGTAILGMWLQGSNATVGFTNSVIEGNTILNGNFQGITLRWADGTVIDHNTLLQTSGEAKTAPSILMATGATHTQVHDNIVGALNDLSGSAGDLANIFTSNLIAQRVDPSAAGYYTGALISTIDATSDLSKIYGVAAATVGSVVVPGVVLVGTDNADTLTGMDGADTISGGRGDDLLTGGKGADTFRFEYAGGHDTITDFGLNHEHDVLDLTSFYKASMRAIVHDVVGGVTIGFSSGDVITLTGVHASDLVATANGFVHI